MAHLSPVLKGREDVGPPEQLNVGVRAVRPHFFEQVLETNHKNRCLTFSGEPVAKGYRKPPSGVARCLDLSFFASLYWPGFGHGNSPHLVGTFQMKIHGNEGGSMRAMSGASLALIAMLTLGTIVSSACSQVGAVQARRSFKAANTEYQAQNYPKAAELYEDALKNDPSLVQAYFFLG